MKEQPRIEILTKRLHRANFIFSVSSFFSIITAIFSYTLLDWFMSLLFALFMGGVVSSFILKTYFEFVLGWHK